MRNTKPKMNLPNRLSLLRVALIPLLVVCMYFDGPVWQVLSIIVFGVASLTDFLDGYIARKYKLITDFGRFVDPLADKMLVLSALIMLCYRQLMLSWVVCLILSRELAVDGLRMIAVGKGRVIAAAWSGKVKTVSQIALVLWMMITQRPVICTPLTDNLIGLLLTVWTVIITLVSGAEYFIKNGDALREDM